MKKNTQLVGVQLSRQFVQIFLFVWLFPFFASAQPVSLIEFGWDYPDLSMLHTRLDSMQGRPFDGICFSIYPDIIETFDSLPKKENYFQYEKLQTLKWGQYKENYLFVRGYSKAGGNWFNDNAWLNIIQNTKALSKALLASKAKGVLFDPEYYYDNPLNNPWTYSQVQYPSYNYEQVKKQVRQRGMQFAKALQAYTPNISFLSIWLSSLIIEDKKFMPTEKTRHALLPAFIEGMLLGKKTGLQIIDGNEYGYFNTKPSEFLEAAINLKKATQELMDTDKGKKLSNDILLSNAIFYDGILAKQPAFNRGYNYNSRWKWLTENLKYAMATSSSKVVWFYNERVDWWRGKVNDTLKTILESSRPALATKNNLLKHVKLIASSANVNVGKGLQYPYDVKQPMKNGEAIFTYTWLAKTKKIQINFNNIMPITVSVFVNNLVAASLTPTNNQISLSLKNYKKGIIAILAKYADKSEACGLIIE